MTGTERIAAAYRDGAETSQHARDAKVAAGYKQSDFMDNVERVAAADRDKVSPHLRIALGLYVDAREAAKRVAGGEPS